MDFKLPNNNFDEKQLKILDDIQLAQNNILAQFSNLNKRISELENSQQIISQTISEISQRKNQDEPISFPDKLDLNIFLTFVATLIICVVLVVFGLHFWDIPSQTQAVNDYIYQQIVKENIFQNAP